MNTILEHTIAGLPCIRINPKARSQGIVLLYHGWISTIHDYLFLGSIISDWGYTVIIPEIPYHGTRGKLNYFDPNVLQQYYWNVVTQAVEEASHLIDELGDENKLVAVIGNSAGGFIAAGVFSKYVSVKSGIVMNGSCAWVRFEEHICARDNREPWISSDKAVVEQLDPIASIDNMRRRALLIVHGTEDTTIPIDSQRDFMQVAEHKNIRDAIKFVEYAKVNHHITLDMLKEVKGWLIELPDN